MQEAFGAVIPACNEQSHIGDVIAGVKRHIPASRIVVVDDGSKDQTAATATSAGVCVLTHEMNRGKGEALRTGFRYMLTQSGVEAIFTLDADGQHDPGEIPAFVDRYRERHIDILIGNRMSRTEGMPLIRMLTNRFTSRVISLRTGCTIEDSQSGYRLIRTSLLRSLDFVTAHFDLESELLIKAGLGGASIDSVPIRTIYMDERSKIDPFTDTVRFFMLVLRSLFW